jgi:hypothetical protein
MYPHLTQLQAQRAESLDQLERWRLAEGPRLAPRRRRLALPAWARRRRRGALAAPC